VSPLLLCRNSAGIVSDQPSPVCLRYRPYKHWWQHHSYSHLCVLCVMCDACDACRPQEVLQGEPKQHRGQEQLEVAQSDQHNNNNIPTSATATLSSLCCFLIFCFLFPACVLCFFSSVLPKVGYKPRPSLAAKTNRCAALTHLISSHLISSV